VDAGAEAEAAAPKDGVPPLPKVKAGAACEAAGIGVDRVAALDPGGLLPKVNPPKGLAGAAGTAGTAGAALVDDVDQLGAIVPAVPPPIPPGRVAVASEVNGALALWAEVVPAEVLPTPKSVVVLLLPFPPLLAAAELAAAPKVKAKALPLPLVEGLVGLADVDAEVAAPKVKAGVEMGEVPSFFGRGSEGALLPLPKVKMGGALLVLPPLMLLDDSAGVVVVSVAGVELSEGRLLVGSVEVTAEGAARKLEAASVGAADSVGAAFGASPKREVVAVVVAVGALKLKVGGVAAGTLGGVLFPKVKAGTGSEAEGLLSAPASCPRAFVVSLVVSLVFSAVSFSFSFSSFSLPGSEGATKGATVVVMEPLQLNPPVVEEGVSEVETAEEAVVLPKVKAGVALGGVAEEAATDKVGRGVLLVESLPLDSPISACCVVVVDFPSPLLALVVVVPSAVETVETVETALGLGAWKVKAGRVWEGVKGVFSPFSPFSPAAWVVVGGVGVVTGNWEGFSVASNRRVGGGRGESEGGSAADRGTEVRGVVFDKPSP
jgi:hypothetical protein